MRFLKVLASVLLPALILTGCAQLPRSGAIVVGPDLGSELTGDVLYYSPVGPAADATQEEIISGFLNAGTGPQNDYATAREYLTEGFKSSWSPSDEVLIQDGRPTISTTPSGNSTVTVSIQGQVDSDGKYTSVSGQSTRVLKFKLSREWGQWRISEAPNLTVVIRPVFDVIFNSYNLYFFDKAHQFLIPDLRWFPSKASTGTRLMNALLKGPSDWLAPAVATTVPEGTKLSIDAVTVQNGVALVDLTTEMLKANTSERQWAKAQIKATLDQLPQVDNVSISVDRSLQEISDVNANQPTSTAYSPVGLVDGQLVHISSGGAAKINGTAAIVQKTAAKDFAISADEQSLALLGPQGVWTASIGEVGSQPKLIDARARLLTPAIDRQGYVWTATAQKSTRILVTDASGEVSPLIAPWLKGRSLQAFSISAEGSRVALLVRSGGRPQILLASVIRSSLGAPVQLANPIKVAESLAKPISVNWVDSNSIAVLNIASANFAMPTMVTIGGAITTLSPISDATDLFAATSSTAIYVLTSTQDLYVRKGGSWSLFRSGVVAAHFVE